MTDLCSKVYCIYFSFLDKILFLLACCCSVAKSYSTLHNPMDCSTLGFPVLHHLSEFAQVFVHCITNAIKTSHPLSPSSPFAFNLSQHQSLFQWVGCSQQVAKYWSSASASVLPMNIQGWFPLRLTDLISVNLRSRVQGTLKILLRHNLKASNFQCSAFFMVQLSLCLLHCWRCINMLCVSVFLLNIMLSLEVQEV